MEHDCKAIPLVQVVVGPMGIVEPLCDVCGTLDCTNPIEKRKVSIVGVVKKKRVLVRGSSIFFVVECSGFTR